MKKLQNKDMKKIMGGKYEIGPGCRCVPSSDLLSICYIIAAPSVWSKFCFSGKRYECLDANCNN
jgi:hypothetical protein